MLNRRLTWYGLLAVLLALMVQLGLGASAPRADLVVIAGVESICHADEDSDGIPTPAPRHSPDCLICPLCLVLHNPAAPLVALGPALAPPGGVVVHRGELPPPSTAPPAPHRPPSQPRAPPTAS